MVQCSRVGGEVRCFFYKKDLSTDARIARWDGWKQVIELIMLRESLPAKDL